jgi:hypothetical protein
MAVFYFFGFASGMFKGDVNSESGKQIQAKSIQIETQAKNPEIAESNFHFHNYSFQKVVDDYAIQSIQPLIASQKEKLIYSVHDIKVHQSLSTRTNFCRPPPTLG